MEEERLERLLSELGARARTQRFAVAPNPCVGAAVLAGGERIAEGFHTAWGGPHAEVAALRAAADSGVAPERWDTLVITLEPCSSQGKTPPCTDAILRSGIRRVVVGDLDPDPRHRGRGLELLQQAGVEVRLLGSRSSALREVSAHFLSWTHADRLRRPRPWLVAKWAQTRTGQLSPPEDVGEGRWISGEASRAEVHRLRAEVDAVLTGVGCVLADDPRLSVRPRTLTDKPPLRVVLDSELRTPPEARLLVPNELMPEEAAGPVHVFCRAGAHPVRHRALLAAGAMVHSLRPDSEGRPDARAALEELWRMGARRVLLEAGPKLIASFFERGLVDQVRVYTGAVSGGRGDSLATILEPSRYVDVEHREVGEDAVLEAFPRPSF